MAFEETFLEAVQKAEKDAVWSTYEGTVSEVNETTCTVEREDLPPLLDVRLDAIEGSETGFVRLIPKVGSTVLCLTVENQRGESCIVKYTEVDKVDIKIGTTLITVDDEGVNIEKDGKSIKQILTDLTNVIAAIVVAQGKGPDIGKLKTLTQDINTLSK